MARRSGYTIYRAQLMLGHSMPFQPFFRSSQVTLSDFDETSSKYSFEPTQKSRPRIQVVLKLHRSKNVSHTSLWSDKQFFFVILRLLF